MDVEKLKADWERRTRELDRLEYMDALVQCTACGKVETRQTLHVRRLACTGCGAPVELLTVDGKPC